VSEEYDEYAKMKAAVESFRSKIVHEHLRALYDKLPFQFQFLAISKLTLMPTDKAEKHLNQLLAYVERLKAAELKHLSPLLTQVDQTTGQTQIPDRVMEDLDEFYEKVDRTLKIIIGS